MSKEQFAIVNQSFCFLHIFRDSEDEVKMLTSFRDLQNIIIVLGTTDNDSVPRSMFEDIIYKILIECECSYITNTLL